MTDQRALDEVRSTIAFLSSVIRSGEPYSLYVETAVTSAFARLDEFKKWICE